MSDYPAFPKIPRLNRDICITEKIDGTNGLVFIREYAPGDDGVYHHSGETHVVGTDNRYYVRAGSRNRWLEPTKLHDNHGFAAWVAENAEILVRNLGIGHHYGEWWGQGIQRGYGLKTKKFSLFNTARYAFFEDDENPKAKILSEDAVRAGLDIVPTLYRGSDLPISLAVDHELNLLALGGSVAAYDFDRPEGVVVFHEAARSYFKVLIEGDGAPKSLVGAAA